MQSSRADTDVSGGAGGDWHTFSRAGGPRSTTVVGTHKLSILIGVLCVVLGELAEDMALVAGALA